MLGKNIRNRQDTQETGKIHRKQARYIGNRQDTQETANDTIIRSNDVIKVGIQTDKPHKLSNELIICLMTLFM
jgi:hypothetical protein